ncbi:MAG: Smr/MutS family protein, partial [bacterium]
GLRVREALKVLEKELETAHLGGRSEVRIVHGIGTGALMKAVHEYLQSCVFVRRFEPGTVYEGGIGVTRVILKD